MASAEAQADMKGANGLQSHGGEVPCAGDMARGDTPQVNVKFVQGWKGNVSVGTDATLEELVTHLCARSNLHSSSIDSLIVRGRRIEVTSSLTSALSDLSISNGTTAMLILRSPQQIELLRQQEERMRKLEECEAAARLLADRDGVEPSGNDYEMNIFTQDGHPIALPEADRRGFLVGVLLHAKGKAILDECSTSVLVRRTPPFDGTAAQVDDALRLFEQAEAAFSLVHARYISMCDNFALLLLDAVWAAMLLQHMHLAAPAVPRGSARLDSADAQRQAVRRLERAKGLLSALHGPNMERLAALDNAGQQRAVYVKLQLLAGVVAYHRGDLDDARSLLHRADELCRRLTITDADDDKVAELMSLGLSSKEARAALLACDKDVHRAASHALERRAAFAAARQQKKEERRRKAAERRFEHEVTASGSAVNGAAVLAVAELGFPEELALAAVQQADNSVEEAVGTLANPETYEALQVALLERSAPPRETAGMAAAAGGEERAVVREGGEAITAKKLKKSAPLDEAERSTIGHSGLEEAIRYAEESYEAGNLRHEMSALEFYLAAADAGSAQ
mmetsp:Transcript_29360/g.71304  ORF Transcript_29360/g.71304 Transcript_29360/m.71304 type:complete len:568 (+) Transcript_29360:23-1726(+)